MGAAPAILYHMLESVLPLLLALLMYISGSEQAHLFGAVANTNTAGNFLIICHLHGGGKLFILPLFKEMVCFYHLNNKIARHEQGAVGVFILD